MITRSSVRDLRQRMQIASVPGDQREVRAAGPEQSSEECERARGRAGDRAPGGAGRSGCRERAELVGRLAADEADGHGEHAERDEEADRGGSVAKSRVRRLLLSSFDGDPGRGGSALGRVDLGCGERRPGLDEPTGRHRLQSELLQRVRGEQRVGRRGVRRKLRGSGSWDASGPGLWRRPARASAWRRSRGTGVARQSQGVGPPRGAMTAKPARSVRPVMMSVFALMALGLIP